MVILVDIAKGYPRSKVLSFLSYPNLNFCLSNSVCRIEIFVPAGIFFTCGLDILTCLVLFYCCCRHGFQMKCIYLCVIDFFFYQLMFFFYWLFSFFFVLLNCFFLFRFLFLFVILFILSLLLFLCKSSGSYVAVFRFYDEFLH